MNTLGKSMATLSVTLALNGLLGVAGAAAGGNAPSSVGTGAAGVGAGVISPGNTGVNGAGTVNGNRNPNRRDPDVQQPSTPEPGGSGTTDSLQQQRQQSGEQMIQERKGQAGDTR
ncbi:hypothetical protein [Pseudomonas huanghezhanensis]|uniref:hypothetical protein n=1 Tax=Pseudomonas huanghezhanensis TaxID=3002903 RepID=UPI002285F8D0|nr:hypothetical protein [Pseudomonas sp. BSw22131]